MKVEIINSYHSKIYNCIDKLSIRYSLLITYKVTYDNNTIITGELTTNVDSKPDTMHEIETTCKGIILHYLNLNNN